MLQTGAKVFRSDYYEAFVSFFVLVAFLGTWEAESRGITTGIIFLKGKTLGYLLAGVNASLNLLIVLEGEDLVTTRFKSEQKPSPDSHLKSKWKIKRAKWMQEFKSTPWNELLHHQRCEHTYTRTNDVSFKMERLQSSVTKIIPKPRLKPALIPKIQVSFAHRNILLMTLLEGTNLSTKQLIETGSREGY